MMNGSNTVTSTMRITEGAAASVRITPDGFPELILDLPGVVLSISPGQQIGDEDMRMAHSLLLAAQHFHDAVHRLRADPCAPCTLA
ncbi:hypothetical protein D5S17_13970 [Pseudonocardiaceae bacterium YIM PH 21723]|nr:hypothetical protein D5S17_13970 [Pseudonocardiaceae bacterium YIM PH 21723]